VVAVRHETLTLAKNALLKTVQNIVQQNAAFLSSSPGASVRFETMVDIIVV
jgi:hypothetical protein